MNRIPIIFDCDTGTDDAIAIISALYAKELDIRAFTTVSGNVHLDYTSNNTLNLVNYLGFNIKVAKGADKPLIRELKTAACHGIDGLGGIKIPKSKEPFYEKDAVDTIYDEAVKLNGELQIVAVAPLTNIAKAILKYPDLKGLIKHITIMGGAVEGGNMTRVAEFNIFVDPEAAKIVFGSGIPITMVGLDVTTKTIIYEEEVSKYKEVNSKAGKLAFDILQYMVDRNKGGKLEAAIMHDGLALGVCIHPEFVKTKEFYVDVETKGEYTSGHTFCDVENITGKNPNCRVAVEVDTKAYKNWLFETISNS